MKVYFAGDLRETDTYHGESVEVVTLVDFEHAIDAKTDAIHALKGYERVIRRLVNAVEEEPLLVAVLRLVEEVEWRREDVPLLVEPPRIEVRDEVPSAIGPGWEPTADEIVELKHPGVDGMVYVTAAAWVDYMESKGS